MQTVLTAPIITSPEWQSSERSPNSFENLFAEFKSNFPECSSETFQKLRTKLRGVIVGKLGKTFDIQQKQLENFAEDGIQAMFTSVYKNPSILTKYTGYKWFIMSAFRKTIDAVRREFHLSPTKNGYRRNETPFSNLNDRIHRQPYKHLTVLASKESDFKERYKLFLAGTNLGLKPKERQILSLLCLYGIYNGVLYKIEEELGFGKGYATLLYRSIQEKVKDTTGIKLPSFSNAQDNYEYLGQSPGGEFLIALEKVSPILLKLLDTSIKSKKATPLLNSEEIKLFKQLLQLIENTFDLEIEDSKRNEINLEVVGGKVMQVILSSNNPEFASLIKNTFEVICEIKSKNSAEYTIGVLSSIPLLKATLDEIKAKP